MCVVFVLSITNCKNGCVVWHLSLVLESSIFLDILCDIIILKFDLQPNIFFIYLECLKLPEVLLACQNYVQKIVCSWFDELSERLIWFCFVFSVAWRCLLTDWQKNICSLFVLSVEQWHVLLEMTRPVKHDRWINVRCRKHPLKQFSAFEWLFRNLISVAV